MPVWIVVVALIMKGVNVTSKRIMNIKSHILVNEYCLIISPLFELVCDSMVLIYAKNNT